MNPLSDPEFVRNGSSDTTGSGVEADYEDEEKPNFSRSQSSDKVLGKNKWKRNDLKLKLRHKNSIVDENEKEEIVNKALMTSPEFSELKFEDDSLVNSMERADMDFERMHGRKTESESEDTIDAM
jgi:hypothetical protein